MLGVSRNNKIRQLPLGYYARNEQSWLTKIIKKLQMTLNNGTMVRTTYVTYVRMADLADLATEGEFHHD